MHAIEERQNAALRVDDDDEKDGSVDGECFLLLWEAGGRLRSTVIERGSHDDSLSSSWVVSHLRVSKLIFTPRRFRSQIVAFVVSVYDVSADLKL